MKSGYRQSMCSLTSDEVTMKKNMNSESSLEMHVINPAFIKSAHKFDIENFPTSLEHKITIPYVVHIK